LDFANTSNKVSYGVENGKWGVLEINCCIETTNTYYDMMIYIVRKRRRLKIDCFIINMYYYMLFYVIRNKLNIEFYVILFNYLKNIF